MNSPDSPAFQEPVWRYARARKGKAWISATHLKLRPGMEVNVVGLSEGGMIAEVTTHWGLEKRMFSHQLDFGYEFRTERGNWIPETDPRALRWLAKVQAELAGGAESRHVGDYGEKLGLDVVERILQRNRAYRAGPSPILGPPWGGTA